MLGVSGLQVLPLSFYVLATIREPTLALHMLLPSRLLLLPRNYGAGVSQTGGRRQNKSFLLWVVFLKYFVTVTKHYLICSFSQCTRMCVISFMVWSVSLCTTFIPIYHVSASVGFFLFPEVEFLPH